MISLAAEVESTLGKITFEANPDIGNRWATAGKAARVLLPSRGLNGTDAMIIHASIPADDPERVARVIAEVWRGEYFPFLFPQTFLVMAGDDRGTTIDVAPRGKEAVPAETSMSFRINASPSPHSEVHLNIATPLSVDEALGIAKRESWTARVCDRGGVFNVIEFWLENKFMLELMTEAESKRYRRFMTPSNVRAMITRGPSTRPKSG